MNQELHQLLLNQQEEDFLHISLEEEFAFYRDISSGNLEVLKGNINDEPTKGMGILSKNPLQNKKYHLVILIAMITRFCIENGLEPEHSYTLSDLYIRKLDNCQQISQLDYIKKEVVKEFTETMHEIKQNRNLSYHVQHGADYIAQNISQPLHSRDVANHLNLHPDYLSKMFRKETGYTLQRYIIRKKCETASYMLRNSSASCTEIGTFLGFSSCSYFITCFCREFHQTPGEYRKKRQL
ncbi:MAG: helix-turn-helix domain-containing protein [Lachnospiraceae bacterium]|nr:helix-turn-helix domain-containing protein [Lachnospiraceae bacterium]